MSGTEILFNSAALHSLKRSQLIKLCKRHGLKANGKNAELIAKLQTFAYTLSPSATFDIPTSDAAMDEMSEGDDSDNDSVASPRKPPFLRPSRAAVRQSEQWEVIEEDSREEENMPTINSQRSGLALSTIGEFGSEDQALTKSSSVSSSIKAFAQSLKRVTSLKSKGSSGDIPADTQQPESIVPAPEAVDISPDESMDEGPAPSTYCPNTEFASSTIRLVSSASSEGVAPVDDFSDELTLEVKGPPVITTFSTESHPFGSGSNAHKRKSSVYPDLPEFALATAANSVATVAGGFATTIPGALPSIASSSQLERSPSTSTNKQPIPPPSKPAFSSASTSQPSTFFWAPSSGPATNDKTIASVMEEMNRRMGVQPNSTGAVSLDLFDRTKGPMASKPLNLPPKVETKGADRFDKAHEELFNKMDSITTHYSLRTANASKSTSPTFKNRKSSGASKARARPSFASTPSAARRRSRASEAASARNSNVGARTSKAFPEPQALVQNLLLESAQQAATKAARKVSVPTEPQHIVVKGTEAQKKRLDQSKAKRRSSTGRQSIGKSAIVGTAQSKAPSGLASRFGFLKSGAKMLRNVLGGGDKGKASASNTKQSSPAPKQVPSSIPVRSPSTIPGGWFADDHESKLKATTTSKAPPASQPVRKESSLGRKESTNGNVPRKPSVTYAANTVSGALFSPPSASSIGTVPPSSLLRSKTVGAGPSSSRSPISSLGKRNENTLSGVSSSRSGLGSFGTAKSRSSQMSSLGRASSTSGPTTSRQSTVVDSTSRKSSAVMSVLTPSFALSPPSVQPSTKKVSTLTAPTASSLAKMHSNTKPSLFPSSASTQSTSKLSANSAPAFSMRVPKVFNPGTASPFKLAESSPATPRLASADTIPLAPITNTTSMEDPPTSTGEDNQTMDFGSMSTSNSASSTLSSASTGSKRRRPRVSRSRVIAKLDEKRAAVKAETGSTSAVFANAAAMKRSSLAIQAHDRRSFALGTGSGAGGSPSPHAAKRRTKDYEVQMSLRKALRKSEAARRKSSRPLSEGALPLAGLSTTQFGWEENEIPADA